MLPSYKIELIGGPKDGHTEFINFVDTNIQYYTGRGRIANYKAISFGRYVFDGYNQVLDMEAPPQKIQYFPEIEELEGR